MTQTRSPAGVGHVATLLIADADPLSRELLTTHLRANGFEVVSTSRGDEAISLFQRHKPDLLLMDLRLLAIDGLHVLGSIRQSPAGRTTPVIVLTADTSSQTIRHACDLGIHGFMLKQKFDLDLLVRQIRRLCPGPPAPSVSDIPESGGPLSPPGADVPEAPAAIPGAAAQSAANRRLGPPPALREAVASLLERKPVIARSRLLETIDVGGELTGFSPAITEVLKLTGNSNSSIDQIARAISRDHAIALKILRLANSAIYTRGDPVDSVHTAVLRIGIGQIRQAVVNLGVVERFNVRSTDGSIDASQFWEHCIATGLIAAELAHARQSKEPDSAFTLGLLHDVGRMVLLSRVPDEYAEVLASAWALSLPHEAVERALLGLTHADIAQRVLQTWKFPRHLLAPIMHHHLPASRIRETAPKDSTEIASLMLADRLAHAFLLGSSGNETIYPTEDLCEMLALDQAVMAHIEATTREEVDKIKFALLATSSLNSWPQLQVVHRAELRERLTATYVSAKPQLDAHRIFVEQLSAGNENSAPNLAVIRVRNSREIVPLCEELVRRETMAGGHHPPLVCISPGGDAAIPEAVAAGRPVAHLQTPFTVRRFIATVNDLWDAKPGADGAGATVGPARRNR